MASLTPVDLEMTAGLPYNRRFRVVGGAAIWDAEEKFEVRSHIRQRKTQDSQLLKDLSPYFSSSVVEGDILIDLSLTGEQTRGFVKGYYDIVISDVGTVDARALTISSGKVKVGTTVTAAGDG